MTTKTTNHLSLDWRQRLRIWLDQRDPWSLALPFGLALLSTIVAVALGVRLSRTPPPVAVQPTPPLPIMIIATPAAMPATAAPVQQVAAVLPNTLSRAVVAYDAPNGSVLGAIEAGRSYQLVERYGADWLHADVDGSGLVWLKSADVTGLPSDLADTQPAPPPQVVYVASQPAAQPAYREAYQPEQAPPAAPEETPPTPGQPIVMGVPLPPIVHASDFTQPDPNARCAFVGCLRAQP